MIAPPDALSVAVGYGQRTVDYHNAAVKAGLCLITVPPVHAVAVQVQRRGDVEGNGQCARRVWIFGGHVAGQNDIAAG